MKKLIAISAAVLSLAAFAATTYAQTVTSVQFTSGYGTAIPSGTSAGAEPENNWYVVQSSGSGIVYGTPSNGYPTPPVYTDAGTAPTGIGFSATSGGVYYSATGASGGDKDLLNSGLATDGAGNSNGWYGGGITLTLTNLQASHDYSFLLYTTGGSYKLAEGSISASSAATQFYTSPNGGYSASYVPNYDNGSTTSSSLITSNAGTAANYQDNYVEFDGITGVTQEVFTLSELGAWPDGVFTSTTGTDPYGAKGDSILELGGFQVIDNGAIPATPEPSTWALMLGGMAILVVMSRRRALKI